MIEILPISNHEEELELLSQVNCGYDEARVLTMAERGKRLGWVALELDKTMLRILKLEAIGYDFSSRPQGEETFILDSLMRSAASYGETFGADSIETAFPDFFDFFRARGFDTDDKHAFAPMSTIVKYEYH